MKQKILAVVGCGASGMAAAIEAANSLSSDNNIKITVYEKLSRPGKKLLATGNGRCNILNADAKAEMYSGNKKLAKCVFGEYGTKSNIAFFEEIGLRLVHEKDGRMYPMSMQASSVLDALRFELDRLGIETICDTKIEKIKKTANGFMLNDKHFADAVIIAGGGKSAPSQGSDGSAFGLLGSLGIKITPVFPSLTGITLKAKNKSLKGIRAKGTIVVTVNNNICSKSNGELQYTDYGVSGIPAMEVSRAVSEHFALNKREKICVRINCLPDLTHDEILKYINSRKDRSPLLKNEDLLSGILPKKLGVAKLERAEIKPSDTIGSLTDKQIKKLTLTLTDDIYEVTGVLGFDNSQVTAGGADAGCFNMKTLEALRVPGLFACGEVMDVDGRCGGYNLGWAWSSGRCAGRNAIKYLENEQRKG